MKCPKCNWEMKYHPKKGVYVCTNKDCKGMFTENAFMVIDPESVFGGRFEPTPP